ncbi:hypothetical protein MKK51_18650 [Methylobacterium sp. E-045]|nr:hypothetical protein [Methylobacterium sp. E-045]
MAATDTGPRRSGPRPPACHHAASQVLGAAGDLSRQSEHLNGEVRRFLDTVRAA